MACQGLHRDEIVEKYLNGQMDSATRDEFEVHLLDCTDCQQQAEALQLFRHELIKAAPRIRAYPPAARL